MELIKKHLQVVIYFLLIFVFVSQSSCISYKKRPARLFKTIIDKGLTFDAGIVPGYPFDGQKWDTIVKGRVLWAKYLYDKGIIRNIIFSGAAVYSPYYEAIIMGLYGEALGIPTNHIFYDTLAQHSTEKYILFLSDSAQARFQKSGISYRSGTIIVDQAIYKKEI